MAGLRCCFHTVLAAREPTLAAAAVLLMLPLEHYGLRVVAMSGSAAAPEAHQRLGQRVTRSDQSSVVVVMAELQVNLLQQRRCRAIARRGGQGPSMDGCGGSCGARWLVDAERTPKLTLLPVGHTRTTVI